MESELSFSEQALGQDPLGSFQPRSRSDDTCLCTLEEEEIEEERGKRVKRVWRLRRMEEERNEIEVRKK